MKTAFIVKAYRTAVGKASKGGFRFSRPDDLAAEVKNCQISSISIIRSCTVFSARQLELLQYGGGHAHSICGHQVDACGSIIENMTWSADTISACMMPITCNFNS